MITITRGVIFMQTNTCPRHIDIIISPQHTILYDMAADVGSIGSAAEACGTQNRIPDANFFTHVTTKNVRQGHGSKVRIYTCPRGGHVA